MLLPHDISPRTWKILSTFYTKKHSKKALYSYNFSSLTVCITEKEYNSFLPLKLQPDHRWNELRQLIHDARLSRADDDHVSTTHSERKIYRPRILLHDWFEEIDIFHFPELSKENNEFLQPIITSFKYIDTSIINVFLMINLHNMMFTTSITAYISRYYVHKHLILG